MSVAVRTARPEDRPAWAAMRAALWSEASGEEHRAEIDATLVRDDAVCFIVTDAEHGVGFAEASIRRDPVNGCDTFPVGFLEGIYVVPDHRRAGVAAALLTAVERWARAKGCTELGSDADEANADGQAFHLRARFEERERVRCYRKQL